MNNVDHGLLHDIIRSIVRPLRVKYKVRDLGDPTIQTDQGRLQRNDFTLLNESGQILHVSHYFLEQFRSNRVIIYLHGNSGCRADARNLLIPIIDAQYSLITFDFAGSGLSDGEYVSLGLNESKDLHTIFQHAVQKLNYKEILLWGRSMGAVTALLFAGRELGKPAGIIADSPFSTFKDLAVELGEKRVFIPGILLGFMVNYVIQKIAESYRIDLSQCEVLSGLHKIKCPILLLASREDQLVSFRHTQLIFSRIESRKKLLYVQGKHNQRRELSLINDCLAFFNKGHSLKRITQSLRSINQLSDRHTVGSRNRQPQQLQTNWGRTTVGGWTNRNCVQVRNEIKLRRQAYLNI